MKVYLAGSFAYKDKEKTKTHQRQLEWAAHLLKEKGLDEIGRASCRERV